MPPDTAIERQNEILVDLLAKAVVYLQAIENAADRDNCSFSWLVGTITDRARSDVYEGWRHEPWLLESFQILRRALLDKELSISDTAEYQQCLLAIKEMVNDGSLSDATDSPKAAS